LQFREFVQEYGEHEQQLGEYALQLGDHIQQLRENVSAAGRIHPSVARTCTEVVRIWTAMGENVQQ
jgi:hypothetical protein